MGKKHRHEHHEEHVDESWLIPYADVLTLLLALFIVLFASAQVDQKKFDQLAQSFNAAFQGSPALMDNVRTIQQMSQGQPKSPGTAEQQTAKSEDLSKISGASILPDRAYVEETLQLIEVKKMLDEYIEKNGLAGQLEASLSEDGLMVRIKDTALFESGRADLLPQSRVFAGEVAKMLAPLPQRIFVSGHTDNVPINTAEFPTNWDLSTRRALNFMKFLLTQEPASKAERFSVTGFGEYQPIAPNTTPEGRATNRRVEILIMRNHPVRSQ